MIYLSEISEQESREALDEVELVNAGNRRSKIKRLQNYVFRVNTTLVTVTASEVTPSFSNTTMVGTLSRGMEGFVTLSELGHGVTTSIITPSTLTVPLGLALEYGYANISYTGPRDSFHLPGPILPPMRLSRASVEKEYQMRPPSLNLDVDHERRTHEDQGQYSRLPGTGEARNDDIYHEEPRLPERGYLGGYPENHGLGLTTSRFGPRREIQDLSRFVYNWKISFSSKPGASVEDFLTRLEECRGITPISDDDLLRALPWLLKDVALLCFRISNDEWQNWFEFKTAFGRRVGNHDFAARVREKIFTRTQGPQESVDNYLTHLRGLIVMLRDRVLV